MQVDEMRDRYGIYMVSDSRMNIAALNAKAIHKLTEAIIAVKV
jgi:aspartate/tyrosine/aromatic aminotransferase